MPTRHDPATARDGAAAGDDSAWLDTAAAGASAWDDQSDGDASAWAGPAESSASVWDDDSPAPASVWDDDAPALPGHASRTSEPGTTDTDPTWADDPVAAPPTTPRSRARARTARSDEPRAAGARRRPSGAGDVAAEQSPEVAAVAARLAEIVARSGGARAGAGSPAEPDDRHPAPARAAGRTSGGEPVAAASAVFDVEAPDIDAPDGDAPDGDAPHGDAPDEGPVTGRRASGGHRQGGARRPPSGRRRAPATEPPGSGAAAADAEPDPESVARAIALRQLTAAPRSRAQLAEAMAKRDVPEDVADRVLDRFTEVGLVDDVAYAEVLVRSRHAERGMSRRALAMELRRKGVDDEVAREALEQVDDADEEQAARALARKKLRATRGLDREVRLRRAYGALGRRGYGGSLVSRVVREELEAEGAEDPEPGDDPPGDPTWG